MHICVGDLTIIDSDNCLSHGRRQAIIWTNAELWLNGPLGTNFSEFLIEILTFSFQENAFESVVREMAAIFLGSNVLMIIDTRFAFVANAVPIDVGCWWSDSSSTPGYVHDRDMIYLAENIL